MRLVKLTDANGHHILINFDQVHSVSPCEHDEGLMHARTIIETSHCRYSVLEDFATVDAYVSRSNGDDFDIVDQLEAIRLVLRDIELVLNQ